MAGYLAGTVKKVHFNDLRRAMIYGSVLASFCVEAFSLERLRTLSIEEVAKRYQTFKLMLRKFSSNAFGIADGTHLGRKIALVTAAILLTATVDLGARDAIREWIVLENCRLIMNPANDGDSFHASTGDKEYLFRLYLVDEIGRAHV